MVLLLGLSQALLAQEDIFKDYAKQRYLQSYCLYPSTLRMLNLNDNTAFDELASSIDKLLIYELDSVAATSQSFDQMLKAYREEGFEEYVHIIGAGQYTTILGKESRIDEMVGVITLADQVLAFFLRGNVAWQKIPTLMNTLQENDVFNVLNLKTEEWN